VKRYEVLQLIEKRSSNQNKISPPSWGGNPETKKGQKSVGEKVLPAKGGGGGIPIREGTSEKGRYGKRKGGKPF